MLGVFRRWTPGIQQGQFRDNVTKAAIQTNYLAKGDDVDIDIVLAEFLAQSFELEEGKRRIVQGLVLSGPNAFDMRITSLAGVSIGLPTNATIR